MLSDPNPFAAAPNRHGVGAAQIRMARTEERAAAEVIAAAAQLMQRIQADGDLSARLLPLGYGPAEFVTGITLQVAAEDMADLCHVAWESLLATVAERDALWLSAREDYLEFRETVRLECAEPGALRTLHVTGTMAGLLPDFVAQAAASYRAAKLPRFSVMLASRGFPATRLADTTDLLQQLVRLEELLASTHERVQRLLEERAVAVGMLNAWIRDLLKSMRVALDRTCHPPAQRACGNPRNTPVVRLRRTKTCSTLKPPVRPE